MLDNFFFQKILIKIKNSTDILHVLKPMPLNQNNNNEFQKIGVRASRVKKSKSI